MMEKETKKKTAFIGGGAAGGMALGASALGEIISHDAGRTRKAINKAWMAPEYGASRIRSGMRGKKGITAKVVRNVHAFFRKSAGRSIPAFAVGQAAKGTALGYGGYRIHKAIKNSVKEDTGGFQMRPAFRALIEVLSEERIGKSSHHTFAQAGSGMKGDQMGDMKQQGMKMDERMMKQMMEKYPRMKQMMSDGMMKKEMMEMMMEMMNMQGKMMKGPKVAEKK